MDRSISLIDAHVHVYNGIDVSGMLSAAAKNFESAATKLGVSDWQSTLFLTEIATIDWFDAVAAAGQRSFGHWQVSYSSADPISLKAVSGGTTLNLIAGRQIVTAEKIEIHAFGTRDKFADGQDSRTTLQAVTKSGAIAAIPWGVGKWTGSRGGLVLDLLTTSGRGVLFAADNGGRPGFWSEPRLAARRDQPVLRGSDPLPLRGEEYRVGEFGSWLEGKQPAQAPGRALLERVAAADAAAVHAYGAPEGLIRFVRNQLLMRLGQRIDRA